MLNIYTTHAQDSHTLKLLRRVTAACSGKYFYWANLQYLSCCSRTVDSADMQHAAHHTHIQALLGLRWKGGDIQIFFQYSDWIFLFDVRIISSEVNYVTRGHPNLWFMNIRKAALYSALHSHARAQRCCPAPAAARPVCKVILASNLHNMRLPAQSPSLEH